MFTKWFEKKAKELGYVKLSDLDEYKKKVFSEVKDIALVRDNFNPRIKAIEKRNKEISDKNIILEGKILKIEAQAKKYEPLFTAVASLREKILDYDGVWDRFDKQDEKIKSIKEESSSANIRLNQLARAKDEVSRMEKVVESFKGVEDLKAELEETQKDLKKNSEALLLLSKENKKDIKALKDRFNRVRINGHPLNSDTRVVITDLDLSFVNNLETRVKKDLKSFGKEVQKEVDDKLIPHTEKEQKLAELNKKVDDIVRVNSNVKTLRKQKTFDELYREVVRGSKKKL